MSALRKPLLLPTSEEYLHSERIAPFKSEYVNGTIVAMAGATVGHNRIAANLMRHLGNRLAGRPCDVFGSDMKVRMDKANVFRYPDISGLCGPILFHDKTQDAYCNPSVIIEIMSPSTEMLDRGEKFTLYRLLDSLREYVLISQDRMRVETFVRDADGQWLVTQYDEPSDSFDLRSLGCSLTLAEVYEKVTLQ